MERAIMTIKILHKITGAVLFEAPDADLRDANLQNANLQHANLRDANLHGAHLWGAHLQNADLRGANLWGADLRGANLQNADLRGANLQNANLRDANLQNADLRRANLRGANLRGAHLRDANLHGADLQRATLPEFQIPQEGELICWKALAEDTLAKVKIPANARRTASLVGHKCRAEFIEVLEIIGGNGVSGSGLHDGTEYKIGENVRPDKYDDDIRIECTHGIHFFQTRQEAENYNP